MAYTPSSPQGKTDEDKLATYREIVQQLQKKTQFEGSGFDPKSWYGVNPALDKWHTFVDQAITNPNGSALSVMNALAEILDDDLVFHPPTYWKSRKGKMIGKSQLIFALTDFQNLVSYSRIRGNRFISFNAFLDY